MKSYDLERFISRQKIFFPMALREIEAGKKRSHWIWFIFPQLKILGRSETAKFFGIEDIDEARAYMQEPFLRENLITVTRALLKHKGITPYDIMGDPDHLKLCSCMTLFELASPEVPEFAEVLDCFYGGRRDHLTLDFLGA